MSFDPSLTVAINYAKHKSQHCCVTPISVKIMCCQYRLAKHKYRVLCVRVVVSVGCPVNDDASRVELVSCCIISNVSLVRKLRETDICDLAAQKHYFLFLDRAANSQPKH